MTIFAEGELTHALDDNTQIISQSWFIRSFFLIMISQLASTFEGECMGSNLKFL